MVPNLRPEALEVRAGSPILDWISEEKSVDDTADVEDTSSKHWQASTGHQARNRWIADRHEADTFAARQSVVCSVRCSSLHEQIISFGSKICGVPLEKDC